MAEEMFKPVVAAESGMKEMTVRAVLLGVAMAVLMAAANAYLGLKAGMTIAATYTTAVVGMAVIKGLGGTLLEENCARTVGSIGGNIAAGAIFTLPAFFITGAWNPFYSLSHYLVSTVILILGGILGIMFVTVTRRILVSDAELPFPESVAAAEIHKAGQKGAGGFRHLLAGMGVGISFKLLTKFKIIALKWSQPFAVGNGSLLLTGPEMSSAFLGVGYIIGPKLAAVNFSGGVLAWGLLAPAIAFFLHPHQAGAVVDWSGEINRVWGEYVRYIAIGGMLVGAFYTLFKMRRSLASGIARSFATFGRGRSAADSDLPRTDRDIPLKAALLAIATVSILFAVVFYLLAGSWLAALIAMVMVLALGFIYAAVSGYLVGIIGVSSNPTSGLTVSVMIFVSLVMMALGLRGESGLAAALIVAAFTCVTVSVAGEMMQDLKAGHILGCTPWRMQLGDIFGVTAAALAMFLVLSVLHLGDIKEKVAARLEPFERANLKIVLAAGANPDIRQRLYPIAWIKGLPSERQNDVLGTKAGLGSEGFTAPQASLMAVVARSLMLGRTEWIMIAVGILMGLGFILMQIRSPMLVAVGMYLPIETSFAIFLGGVFKSVFDRFADRMKLAGEEREGAGNTGTLLASGLIAGEALTGIVFAALAFAGVKLFVVFQKPSYLASLGGMALIGSFLVALSARSRRGIRP